MAIDINQALIEAGTKYKRELLAMVVAALNEMFPYVTLQTGIQGKIVGGVLTTDAQLRPYRTDKGASDNTKIDPFEWETFLGDVVKEFDPNAILGTLYTEATDKKPTEREIAKRVALEIAKKVGEAIYDAIFTAKRNPAGETTAELFNGYCTIIVNQITAGTPKVSVSLKNFIDDSAVTITSDNVGDVLKAYWRGLNKLLKKQKVNFYINQTILEMYEDWFQVEYGHAPWNSGFEQKYLIGSNKKCTLVPFDNMEGQPYIFITIKDNVKMGVDQMSDVEKVRIRECDNPKLVQFFMMAYFGVGYETFDARYFKAFKIAINPITDFANSAVAATTANFTWSAAENATSLKVQVSTDGGSTWADATHAAIAVDAETIQVTGLTAETDYKFRLVVVDGGNNGISNVVSVTTTA